VIGDFGSASSAENNVANNQNTVDPPLLMTVGDNAYQSGTRATGTTTPSSPPYENQLLRRALFMTTLGNHDLNDVGPSNWHLDRDQALQQPDQRPAGNTERYYSFDHGDAHFVVLDANSPAIGATQDNWLDNDLAATTRKWKFVFLHQTPYSCANGIASIGSDADVRSHWGRSSSGAVSTSLHRPRPHLRKEQAGRRLPSSAGAPGPTARARAT